MKKIIATLLLFVAFTGVTQAQDKMTKHKTDNVISLEQTPGEFTQKSISVSPGTYVFEITNNDAADQVGFVLVKKGQDVSNPENHIKTAYVTKAVERGTKEMSKPTTLEKGEYVYFCPLNKTTTDNTLIVK